MASLCLDCRPSHRAAREVESVMGELSVDDRERLKNAIVERSEIRAQQALQWVRELYRVAGELSARGTAAGVDTQSIFWIRLHGVLVEVGENYEDSCKLMAEYGVTTLSIGRHTLAVRDAIRAIRDSMDEDERLWVHYRRDTECHVWQESYELSLRKKSGTLKEVRAFALLGKELHVDDIDKRARALLRKHGVNEPAMAVHFAKLVVSHVAKVLEAMRPLYEPSARL